MARSTYVRQDHTMVEGQKNVAYLFRNVTQILTQSRYFVSTKSRTVTFTSWSWRMIVEWALFGCSWSFEVDLLGLLSRHCFSKTNESNMKILILRLTLRPVLARRCKHCWRQWVESRQMKILAWLDLVLIRHRSLESWLEDLRRENVGVRKHDSGVRKWQKIKMQITNFEDHNL